MNLDDYFGTGRAAVRTSNTNSSLAKRAQEYSQPQQQASSNPLESIFNSLIVNPGKSIVDFFGEGTARAGNLLAGKGMEKANEEAEKFGNWVYGTNDKSDTAAKRLGSALDLAAAGTNVVAPGIAGALTGGALRGIGSEYTQMGKDADLGRALARGAVGAIGEGASAGLMRGVGNLAGKGTGVISKAAQKLTNPATVLGNAGRGALSGTVEGAIQGAGDTLAYGGSIEDALNAGIQGAGSGALMGGIGGGAMGLGAKSVRSLFGKNGNIPATSGTPDVADATPSGTAISSTRRRLAEKLQGVQSNLTRAEARNLKINPGSAIAGVSRLTGISDLDAQSALARTLTGGADSIMDEIQNYNISNVKGKPITVDTAVVRGKIEQLVDQYIPNSELSGAGRQRLVNALKQDLVEGSTIQRANALKDSAAYRSRMGANASPLQQSEANLFNALARELDDLSYSAVPKENVTKMFDDTVEAFRFRASEAANAGDMRTSTAFTKLADELNNTPRTIAAYRSFKKPFVDVSQIDRMTQYAENGAASNMGKSARGVLRSLVDTVVENPTKKALAKVGAVIDQTATTTPKTQKVRASARVPQAISASAQNIIGTNEGLRAVVNQVARDNQEVDQGIIGILGDYLAGGGNISNIVTPNELSSESTQNIMNGLEGALNASNSGTRGAYGSNMGMGITQASQASPSMTVAGRTVSLADVERAMVQAAMAGDTIGYAQLEDIYSVLVSQYERTQEAYGSGTQQKLSATQQRANAAEVSLNQLASMTPDTGYWLSGIPVVGDIATAGGNQYESTARSLALQIGYMLSGANVPEAEAERIGRSYVPQPWDSEETRIYKLNQARNIIGQYQSAYAEEPSLESTLAYQR